MIKKLDYWSKNVPLWELHETSFLFAGTEPPTDSSYEEIINNRKTKIGEIYFALSKCLMHERKINNDKLGVHQHSKLSSTDWIALADKHGIEVPVQLREAVKKNAAFEDKSSMQAGKLEPVYTTPYLELMKQAIIKHKITAENQGKTAHLSQWFLDNGMSKRIANAMATIIRLPESKAGAGKPRKNG